MQFEIVIINQQVFKVFALKSFKLTWNIFSLTLDSVDDPDTLA